MNEVGGVDGGKEKRQNPGRWEVFIPRGIYNGGEEQDRRTSEQENTHLRVVDEEGEQLAPLSRFLHKTSSMAGFYLRCMIGFVGR